MSPGPGSRFPVPDRLTFVLLPVVSGRLEVKFLHSLRVQLSGGRKKGHTKQQLKQDKCIGQVLQSPEFLRQSAIVLVYPFDSYSSVTISRTLDAISLGQLL